MSQRVCSAASRYRLAEAAACRERLEKLELGIVESTVTPEFDSAEARATIDLGPLLRPHTAAAVTSTVSARCRPVDKMPESRRDHVSSATTAVSVLDIIRRKQQHSAGHARLPFVPRSSPTQQRRSVSLTPQPRSSISKSSSAPTNQLSRKQRRTSTQSYRTSRPESRCAQDPVAALELACTRTAMEVYGVSTSSNATLSLDLEERGVVTLGLSDIVDEGDVVFGRRQRDDAIEGESNAYDCPDASSSAADTSEDDEEAPYCTFVASQRNSDDQQVRTHDLSRMKAEIERYELSCELARLVAYRESLESAARSQIASRAETRSKQETRLAEALATDRFIDAELDAQWKAHRAALNAERRALRIRQNPDDVDGTGIPKRKFYKPKFASAWAEDGGGMGPADTRSSCRTDASEKIKTELMQHVTKCSAAAPRDDLRVVTSRREASSTHLDAAGLQQLPPHMLLEIQRMRAAEVLRCEMVLEVGARHQLEESERQERFSVAAIARSGWMQETTTRAQIASDEALQRAAMQASFGGTKHRIEVSSWAPEIYRDRQHLESRLAQHTATPAERDAKLEEATEAHRAAVRAQWADVLSLREELLKVVRTRVALKDDIRRVSMLISLPTTTTDGGNALHAAVGGGRSGVSRAYAAAVVSQQRVDVLRVQLQMLEAREAVLRRAIEEKSKRVW